MSEWEPVVGMEIHVELKTKSKMFCGCKNDPFHAPKPNIYTCPVCLGMPGGLPVPNKKAVEWTIMLGLALGCEIPLHSKFDRKNYFYPDLAKGYQISQYDEPFCVNGRVHLPSGDVRIHRVHLEEDTGKLLHKTVNGKKVSLIDFNRCGVPLMEIVTEADIHSAEQAREFLKKLYQIIRYLDVSDADMEKGTMRLEPNISVRPVGDTHLPAYKVEVKNINSFAFVKKAIEYETERHITFLEKGEKPPQETRGWNEDKGVSFPQRSKENAEDYRYFPDPDIPPIVWEQGYIDGLKKQLPKLPDDKFQEFVTMGFPTSYASLSSVSPSSVVFVETAYNLTVKKDPTINPKTFGDWLFNRPIDIETANPNKIAEELIQSRKVVSIPDEEIQKAISDVLAANPKAVADFKAGKEQVKMFLFGNVLKTLKGKGDKKKVMEILQKSLTV
jgi:aspartyl-tRNA(Asn)/glutamyl-tRNA(Gln) amidotransferase subunit B